MVCPPKETIGMVVSLHRIFQMAKLGLLDLKIQESYYNIIVDRYMQFCAAAGRDDDALEKAFTAFSLDNPAREPSFNSTMSLNTASLEKISQAASSKELAVMIMSMRKLREAIVASSRTDSFSQRAYVFIIRASILTASFESYQPALLHLLYKIHLHTPLSGPELHEFVSYYILDVACRLRDLGTAFALRKRWAYNDISVQGILAALVHDDWLRFWRLKGAVDGYQRRLLRWVEDDMRKHALKCIGKSYLTVDRGYVEQSCGRAWDELQEKDGVSWEIDGQATIIRRIKKK
jgi:hypothetical protein